MKFEGESVELTGVLRLRGRFAARSCHCAQDDRLQLVSQFPQSVSNAMTLFPMFMKLEGRSCLVVGAGTIGEPKISSLIEAGASVRVVALHATAAVAEWAKRERLPGKHELSISQTSTGLSWSSPPPTRAI